MNVNLIHRQISATNPLKVTLAVKVDDKDAKMDSIDLSKESKRKEFVESCVKDYPGIDADDLSDKLLSLASKLATVTDDDDDIDDEVIETPLELSAKALEETDSDVVEAAKEFLIKPNLVDIILKHVEDLGVVGEKPMVLGNYLTNTSRLLPRPNAAINVGASSSGKSKASETVAKLYPSETIFLAHRLTPAALQYLPAGTLIHRAVIAGERSRNTDDGAAEATRALREMISEGVLRIAVTGKDAQGNLTTHHLEQQGPISYTESTTLGHGEIFDEDRTRFIFLCADESEHQSRAVLTRLANDAMNPVHNEHIESIISLHHTMQRLLKAGDVVVPYANELIEAIPCQRPESRRAFGHLLNLIKACALLHQYQREKDEAGRVIAEVHDYDVIREYLSDAIGRGLGVTLSSGAEGLLESIEGHYAAGDTFTASDLKELTGMGRVVYDRLKELRHHGYLKMEPGAGNQGAKYEINPIPGGAEGLELPEIKNYVPASPVQTCTQNDKVLCDKDLH